MRAGIAEGRSRRWWLVGGVGIVLALIAGIVWATGDGETVLPGASVGADPTQVEADGRTEQAPGGAGPADDASSAALASMRPPAGLTVVLSPFVAGAPVVAVGRSSDVMVQVSGIAAIVAVELWAGAELVDVVADASRDDPTWSVPLTWRPQSPGAALVVARAIDADGRSAVSNPLTMHVVEPSAPVAVVQYRTAPGDTPASIASGFGVPVDLLVGADRSPDDAFEAGEVVGVPQVQLLDDVPPPDSPDPDAAAPERADGSSAEISAAVAGSGCEATVAASFPDLVPAGRVTLLRASTRGGTFQPLSASAESVDGAVEFAGVHLAPGGQLFAAEVSTGAGATETTPPVLVEGSVSCGGSWDGPLRIEDGALLGVPDSIDRVFFFVGTGAAWQRVPADGQASLTRFGPGFDVTREMPDLGNARHVEIEVWGWQQGSLVELGRSRFDATPGFDPTLRLGHSARTSLSLITSSQGAIPEKLAVNHWQAEPGVHRFRWATNVPGTSHGVWQVLTFAPTPNMSPMTLGVLAQGPVEGSSGTFEIDLATIVNGPLPSAQLTSLLPSYAELAGPTATTATGERRVVPPGGLAFQADAQALHDVTAGGALLPPIENFHVRVVPMAGDQWSGVATNSVLIRTGDPNLSDLIDTIDFDALNEPIDPNARPYELQATIVPPTPPNPGYGNCWEFVGWNQAERAVNFFKAKEYAWWDAFNASIGVGTPICPGVCYSTSLGKVIFSGKACGGSGFYIPVLSELIAAGGSLWDLLVTGFNAIKGFVVSTVVTLSGCEALASKAFCNTMATLAVNGVLAAYGIPPSLPNAEQLKQAAKGELKEAILGAAQGLGVPCAELGAASSVTGQEQFSCEALLDNTLDLIDKQVSDYFASAAYQSAGISFPPGAIVRPAALGQTGPAIVTMTLTPTAGAPQLEGKSCSAKITIRSSWTPPTPGVGFGAVIGAASIVPNGSVARLPNWATGASGSSSFTDLWAVPKQPYDGYLVTAVVDLPTEGLTFTAAGPSGSATRTYLPSFNYTDPVPGVYMRQTYISSKQQTTWVYGYASDLPYHALQLHPGANFLAEIYSPCFGVYRYTNPILGLFGFFGAKPFVKVS